MHDIAFFLGTGPDERDVRVSSAGSDPVRGIPSEPRKLAAQARYEARHATYLAQLIERVLKEESDDQAGVEALILSWEEPLKRIATEMELSAQFDKGLQGPMQEINEHAGQQAQEGRRLKQELTDRDDQLAVLDGQLKKLESRLGGVSEERVALQRRVDAQERMRASVRALEASFRADEARVTRQQNLVLANVPDDAVETTVARLEALGLRLDTNPIRGGSIACTGEPHCNYSVTETKTRLDTLIEGLEERFGTRVAALRLHLDGCPRTA